MKLTTYNNSARLDITEGDDTYSVVAWHDGEMNWAHAEENGVRLGGFCHRQDEEDRWSIVELILTVLFRCSPSVIDAPTIKKLAQDIALYQRSLL